MIGPAWTRSRRGFFAPVSNIPDHNLPPLAQMNRAVLASVRSCFWTLLAWLDQLVLGTHFVHFAGTKLFRPVHTHVNFEMRRIVYYLTDAGRSPVDEFVATLSARQQEKVGWALRMIEQTPRLSGEYLKKLTGTDELWEVRVRHGGTALRLLGFFSGADLVLVSGFSKKTDQIPILEIRRANERRRDYLERSRGNE